MANSIAYVTTYKNIIDRVFTLNSLTKILEANPLNVQMGERNSNKVKIKRLSVEGLGTYTRLDGDGSGGYSQRNATVAWDEYGLSIERSASYTIDAADMEEAQLNILEVAKTLTEEHVTPEVDAYRFQKIYKLANAKNAATQSTPSYDNIVTLIDAGIAALDDRKIPKQNRVIYIANSSYQLLKKSGEFYNTRLMTSTDGTINRNIMKFDDMDLISVPQDYFKSSIDLLTGESSGWEATAGAKNINFMICYKPSILPITKIDEPKIVDNAYNMNGRGYFYAYLLYHDLLIPTNKLDGVYIDREVD